MSENGKSISQLLEEYNNLGNEKLLQQGANFKPRASFKDKADAVRSLEKLNALIKVREENFDKQESQEIQEGVIVEDTSKKENEKMPANAKKKTNAKVKSATPRKGGRSRYLPDQKITVLAKENPRREGTGVYKQFELARKHKNVGEYLKAGGSVGALKKGVAKKWLKVD